MGRASPSRHRHLGPGFFAETAARIAVDEGHLRADTDPGQVAFEAWGIMLATHDAGRLLGDPKVAVRSQRAFDALLARHR